MRVRWESDSDTQIRFAEVGLAMIDLFQLGLLRGGGGGGGGGYETTLVLADGGALEGGRVTLTADIC